MSRIGKQIIKLPSGVKVTPAGSKVTVEGPKGRLEVPVPMGIGVELEDGTVRLKRDADTPDLRAKHGLTRALVANAVNGVSRGFEKKLDVVGIGYKVEVRGKYVNLALGHSHPIDYPIPEGLTISVEREPRTIQNYISTIKIAGADRYRVGQAAAEIRSLRPPDAYKGKGIRYSTETVKTKAGKKGA